ncbi:MAG: TRAP transporter substrate-binding protein [Alphaproteobacteria bacterium]|nr:TRAP transporter substrate-binding protein [Alphaproteobacteria bacterium]
MRARTGRLLGVAAAAIAAAAVALSAGEADAQQKFKWRFQSLWAANSINMKIFTGFTDRVRAMSGGRLDIEPLADGTVVKAGEMFNAVRNGVLDGQNGGGGYNANLDVAFILLGDLAGAYERPEQMQIWYEYRGGKEISRELYAQYNAMHVGFVWHGVESIPLKKPVRSTADLKGLKMRSPTGPVSSILSKFGGAPVTMHGGEVYPALERGVIDATDWGTLSMNDDLGFHKIARYAIYPGFHSMPATDIVVNMDKWKSLPDDLKALLEVATRDFARDMVQQLVLADEKVVRDAGKTGVEFINWSAEERKKFRVAAVEVWQELSTKTPAAKKVVDSQVNFLKELRLLD